MSHRSDEFYRQDNTKFLSALATADPTLHADLASAAKKHPRLTERAIKAADIYLQDKVSVLPDGDYEVQSQTNNKIYLVTTQNISCTCPDTRHNAPFGPGDRRWCKHMIAASMHHRYQVANGREV
jgi:hypothetical protein